MGALFIPFRCVPDQGMSIEPNRIRLSIKSIELIIVPEPDHCIDRSNRWNSIKVIDRTNRNQSKLEKKGKSLIGFD